MKSTFDVKNIKRELTQFISPSDEESIFMNRAVTWSSFCVYGMEIRNHTD